MTLGFDRPVGAPADLAELEYVAALHQSQPGELRPEASVKDIDIVRFLKSRYGIEVDVQTVRDSVLTGLGGGFDGNSSSDNKDDAAAKGTTLSSGDEEGDDGNDSGEVDENDTGDDEEEEEEVIDLAELTAVLLIPTLIQAARQESSSGGEDDAGDLARGRPKLTRSEFDSDADYTAYRKRRRLERSLQPPAGVVGHVLSMIMNDVTGGAADPRRPKRVTPDLMREILVAYGEEELSRDEGLLEEMVAALRGGDDDGGGNTGDDDDEGAAPYLNARAFARALTADVSLYDAGNVARETSPYDDVLAASERPFADDTVRGGDGEGNSSPPEQALAASSIEGKMDNEEAAPAAGGLLGPGNGAGTVVAAVETRRVFTAGALDYVADTYRSKLLVVLLWTGFFLMYVAYYDAIDKFIGEARAQNQLNACWDLRPDTYAMEGCFRQFYDQAENTQGLMKDVTCEEDGADWYLGCLVLKSLLSWLYILALLMAFGLAYVGLGSIGNSVLAKRKWPILIGMFSVGFLSFFFFQAFYEKDGEAYSLGVSFARTNATTGQEERVSINSNRTEAPSVEYEALILYLSLIVSTLVMVLQLFLLIGPLVRQWKCFGKGGAVDNFFTPGSVVAEAQLKRAAARKLNGVVGNAREMHGAVAVAATTDGGNNEGGGGGEAPSFGRALINFSLKGATFEPAGGFLWTWKRIASGELFEEEGVWISGRIWAGNLAQFIIVLFVITFGLVTTRELVEQWRHGLADGETNLVLEALGWFGIEVNGARVASAATMHMEAVMDDFMTLNFGNDSNCVAAIGDAISDMGTNTDLPPAQLCMVLEHAASNGLFDVSDIVQNVTASAELAVKMATDEVADSLYPQEEMMVKAPLLLATFVAFTAAVVLAIIYIPSVTATILRFRSGAIPYLHDRKNSMDYRSQLDMTLTVLGSMIWGALYSAVLLGIIFGGVLFLFLWQATQEAMLKLFALLVGLIITAIIRILLILVFLRATVYSGFYRTKVAQGNIVSLILECANVGYGVGTALARAIKLILISALYIGRMDTPLLAEGVGRGPLRDLYPTIFRKEILAHEAHRHPYLEVLGTMYLMKIRYGDNFGNRAGYTFRLIFTVALMPWIRKYRVMARPNLIDADDGVGNIVDAENFDNSMLLPKSSVLRSSVMAMSLVKPSTVEPPGTSAAAESEIRRLQDQVEMRDSEIEQRDREIDEKEEEIKQLREALQNASSAMKHSSVEVQMT